MVFSVWRWHKKVFSTGVAQEGMEGGVGRKSPCLATRGYNERFQKANRPVQEYFHNFNFSFSFT